MYVRVCVCACVCVFGCVFVRELKSYRCDMTCLYDTRGERDMRGWPSGVYDSRRQTDMLDMNHPYFDMTHPYP